MDTRIIMHAIFMTSIERWMEYLYYVNTRDVTWIPQKLCK